MVGLIGGRGSAFDYIGPDLPSNPQNGEMWFDTDGASDGSGEVKVYDGASSAWEATGFTSHADLTDVTRSAHHPPVSVSGPLTQPTDQSLGLSIGDGLADSAGTLVAALGNGLGIDGNGQVYVPANAVSQSMLGFDTATQAELDGHASNTNNPHSVDHAQLSGVGTADHHAKTTSAADLTDVSPDSEANAHHSPPSVVASGTATVPAGGSTEVYSGDPGSPIAVFLRITSGGSGVDDAEVTHRLLHGVTTGANTTVRLENGLSAAADVEYELVKR